MPLGVCPLIPSDRPAAPAVWWIGRSSDEGTDGDVATVTVELSEAPGPSLPGPPASGDEPVGLAAPCSLPAEFLAFLDVPDAAHVDLTAKRLLAEGRRFAARRTRGDRHPLRFPDESASSLERRRLARLHAALPLLRANPPALLEVDARTILRRLDLPGAGWNGHDQPAIDRRRRILDGLAAGALGDIAVRPLQPDYAIGSAAALEALLAAAVAAWDARRTDMVRDGDPRAGSIRIPLP